MYQDLQLMGYLAFGGQDVLIVDKGVEVWYNEGMRKFYVAS